MLNFSIRNLQSKILRLNTIAVIRTYAKKTASKQKECKSKLPKCAPPTEKKCEKKDPCKKPAPKCSKKESSKGTKNKKKKPLHNQVALVTGGAQGIGYAIACELLKNGVKGLTIADIDKNKGCEAIKELTCKYGEDRIYFIECDVADCNQVDWAFKKTIQYHEGVNIVVNNAGIMDDKKWERQIRVNMAGCLAGSLLAMQYMAKSCSGIGGTVVNVCSIIGLIPSSGCPVHTMTQHGIVGFSRGLGYKTHYKRTGVKIITYCPGLTNTKILKEAKTNAINNKFSKEFSHEIEGCELQKPESVAKNILKIMKKAKPGSVWVSECDEPAFEVKFPTVCELKPKAKKDKCKGGGGSGGGSKRRSRSKCKKKRDRSRSGSRSKSRCKSSGSRKKSKSKSRCREECKPTESQSKSRSRKRRASC